MLSKDASASVLLNGKSIDFFYIRREVRQGCPLAPYLFLLIGEALHMETSEEQRQGRIHRIQLLDSDAQQLVSQYVDDTSILVISKEEDFRNIISLLQHFDSASRLIINWTKSIAY